LCNLNQFYKAKSVLANVVEEDGFCKKQATLKPSSPEKPFLYRELLS
jgi:hypothetical protein